MKLIAFLLTIVIASNKVMAQESFVILDAMKLPADEGQPTWIAVIRESRTVTSIHHISLESSFNALRPGSYTISHIDFQRSRHSGDGTILLNVNQSFSFEVLPNTITIVGMLLIETGQPNQIELQLPKQLLTSACSKNKELIETLPVRIPSDNGSFNMIRMKCN